eukprot:CCRYP_004750-RB/>CCRYP_004750-RB protein AED:0.38 eAED:0.38 QI:59/1/0.75/1/1/1/4/256/817
MCFLNFKRYPAMRSMRCDNTKKITYNRTMMGPTLSTICIFTFYLCSASLRPTSSFHLPTNRNNSLRPTRTSRRKRTTLFYYKPNLPLSSRLSEIKSELSTLQSRGIDKFLLDEIAAAQKRLSNDVQTAEKYADGIVKKGRGEEGRMMREAMKSSGNEESSTALVNGLKGVRQELEEVRGVKALGDVAEETVKNDLLLEKDLQSVTEKVASSLKDAEMTIKSSLATLSSGEMSDDNEEQVLKQLESTAKSIQQSIQTSNTLASSIKKTADDSFSVLERITLSRHDLMDAMEDTEDTIGFIAERQGNGGSGGILSEGTKRLFDVVDNMGSAAYETVNQVEAVEKLANVLTTKVTTEADAILSLNKKTFETVTETLQAAMDVVREFKSDSDVTNLLNGYANKIKQEGESVKQLANAIQSDIMRDKSALEVVKNAHVKIEALLDAAENQVEMSKRAVLTGDTIDPAYVEQNIVDVKTALVAILDATKASTDSAVQKMQQSMAERKETPRAAVEEASPKSTIAEVTVEKGNVPVADKEAEAVESEQKIAPNTLKEKADGEEAKSVQNTEQSTANAKEDGDKVNFEKIEPNTAEAKRQSDVADVAEKQEDAAESAQKNAVQAKEGGDAEKLEKFDQNLAETKEGDGAPKSTQTIEPSAKEEQNEAASRSHESSVAGEKAEKIETPSADKSTKSNNGEVQKENVEDIKHDDEIVQLDEKQLTSHAVSDTSEVALTSDSPAISDISDLMKAPSITEHAGIEPHPDLAEDVHEATKFVNVESTISLDVGDLDVSTSEIVHELAKAASDAAEVVHDLVNVVATSLVF